MEGFFNPVFISLLFILGLFIILFRWPPGKFYGTVRTARGFFIILAFMLAGYATPGVRHSFRGPSCTSDSIDFYYATVVASKGHIDGKERYVLRIKKIHQHGLWSTCNRNILVYLKTDTSNKNIPIKSDVLVSGHPVRVQSPLYNGLFDFRKYLEREGISGIHYLEPNDMVITSQQPNPSFLSQITALRPVLAGELQTMVHNKRAYQVALAMLLGDKTGLDTDTRKAFSAAGVSHVLAVSGLHTGIVFLIISFLLAPLKNKKKLRFLYYFTIITGIWLYAMLTGLSPSVVRAAIMFTMLLLGTLARGKHQVYNSLAAAAFLMLLIQPWLIYSVSFQLSFLAVFGIVLLYPRLYPLVRPKSKPLVYLWKITCVSVAAQMAVFPLLIYYFHQFSLFFILSNLLVMPAAALIISFGMPLLIVESAGISVPLFNRLFEAILQTVTAFVYEIETIPGSSVNGLYLKPAEVWLLYLLLALCVLFLYFRSKKIYVLIALASILTGLVFTNHILRNHRRKVVWVYRIPSGYRIDFIRGNRLWTYFFRDGSSRIPGLFVPPKITGSYDIDQAENILTSGRIHSTPAYDLIVFEGKRFLFLKRPMQKLSKPVHTDYLFIKTANRPVAKLPENLHYSHLIARTGDQMQRTGSSPTRKNDGSSPYPAETLQIRL